MVAIRRIRPNDAELLKSARLAALADSPSAFASTYEREAGVAHDEWVRRARASAVGDESALVLAVDPDDDGGDDTGGDVVGIVGGFRSDGSEDRVELVSMWVAPSRRRLGVGRRLVDEIVGWARGSGAASVGLWVTLGNEPAERLYREAGFHDTDEYQPLPSDPCQHERRMELRLDDRC